MKDHVKFLTRIADEEFFKRFTWFIEDEEGEEVGPWPVNATKDQINEIINELEATESEYLFLRNDQDTPIGWILILPYEPTDQLANWSLELPTKCKEILDAVAMGH